MEKEGRGRRGEVKDMASDDAKAGTLANTYGVKCVASHTTHRHNITEAAPPRQHRQGSTTKAAPRRQHRHHRHHQDRQATKKALWKKCSSRVSSRKHPKNEHLFHSPDVHCLLLIICDNWIITFYV